jgi:hypothetical protein
MIYELWDQASGNRLDGFEGKAAFEKLAQVVREIAELRGLDAIEDLFVEVWASFDAPEPVTILDADELRHFAEPLAKTYAVELTPPAPATRTSQSTFAKRVALAV